MPESYDQKLTRLEEEANARIHWGADLNDIRTYLIGKNGLTPKEAEEIIARAVKSRNKEVRGRALIGIVLWGVGVLLFGGPVVIMNIYGVASVRIGFFLLVVAIPCTFFFLKSIWTFASCENSGPMK